MTQTISVGINVYEMKIGLNAGYIHFIIIPMEERISDRISKKDHCYSGEKKHDGQINEQYR
jgi:hypothetical protein